MSKSYLFIKGDAIMKTAETEEECLPVFLSFVEDLAGENAVDLVMYLMVNKMTDRELAEKTGYKLNKIRKKLYELYSLKIAKYKKQRIEETGWHSYVWELSVSGFEKYILDSIETIVNKLKQRLKFEEENMFYFCVKDRDVLFSFDEATELGFRCPRCSGPLEVFDNQPIIKKLKTAIEILST